LRSPGFVSLWLMLVLLAGPAWSGSDTSTETPYLRIETGRHESTINAIASLGDAALVSVSDDKTARIWSSDFSPIRVLRPPIGPADEGALYSVAISGEY